MAATTASAESTSGREFLASMLVGRFSSLQCYFDGILDDDLRRFTDDILIYAASRPHRLLMTLFVDKLNEANLLASSGRGAASSPEIVLQRRLPAPFAIREDGYLAGTRERTVTSLFSHSLGNAHATKISDLVGVLEANEIDFSRIRKLDFGNCGLYNCDLVFVAALIHLIHENNFPDATPLLVDLSLNLFDGEAFFEFLSSEMYPLTTLDICLTPFLSPKNMQYMEKLKDRENILFIPPELVQRGSWLSLFPQSTAADEEWRACVMDRHDSYYNSKNADEFGSKEG